MSFLGLGGNTSTAPLRTGANQAKRQIKKGINQGIGALSEGLKAASPSFEQAAAGFQPYQQSGQALNNLYTDALSGGQGGIDAYNTYATGAGANIAEQRAIDAEKRNAASLGSLDSGGTRLAIADHAQENSHLYYQQWLDNIFRGSGQGLQAAGGASSALQGLGSMTANNYNNRADVYTGGRSALATNASNLGTQLQGQTAADQASQLSLLTSIIGGGATALGGYFGGKKVA